MQQLGISAAVTTIGSFARTGYAQIDMGSFALDLMMSMISTGVSMQWMRANDFFEVRWVKVHTWGYGKSMLDAVLYRYSPMTQANAGDAIEEATRRRFEFNMAWTTETTWTSPVVFTILNGTECMLGEQYGIEAGNAFGKRMFWGKLAAGLGNSIIYFHLRKDSEKRAAR